MEKIIGQKNRYFKVLSVHCFSILFSLPPKLRKSASVSDPHTCIRCDSYCKEQLYSLTALTLYNRVVKSFSFTHHRIYSCVLCDSCYTAQLLLQTVFILKWPMFAYASAWNESSLEIDFIYFGNKEVSCFFRTWCIICFI